MVSLHAHAREACTSTPIVDCHTHTSFSDGTSTFEQNAPTPDGDWQTFSL